MDMTTAAATTKKKIPANSNRKLEFKANDHVVYPTHGVGKIMRVEEQEVAGAKLELFVITFEKDKMTLRVPVAKIASVGMRKLAAADIVGRKLAAGLADPVLFALIGFTKDGDHLGTAALVRYALRHDFMGTDHRRPLDTGRPTA